MQKSEKCRIIVRRHCTSSDTNRVENLKQLFERGKQGPFATIFNSQEMQHAFERALDPTFEVHVIATVSSGKSTFVNAMLSRDIVPESNLACTATIMRIENQNGVPFFSAKRFDSNNVEIERQSPIDSDILTIWNSDTKTSLVEIQGDIPMLKEAKDANIVLIDTPGPNNSRNSEHKRKTLDAIKEEPMAMVIYILNSTALSTNDDKWLLHQVSEAMETAGRQAQDRFIFVANKADCFDPEDGEDVSSALDNVRTYFEQPNDPIFGDEPYYDQVVERDARAYAEEIMPIIV